MAVWTVGTLVGHDQETRKVLTAHRGIPDELAKPVVVLPAETGNEVFTPHHQLRKVAERVSSLHHRHQASIESDYVQTLVA
jgi:hypothetical protein